MSNTVETPIPFNQACKQIPCSRSHGYTLIARGQLRAVKRGGRTFVFPSEIARFHAEEMQAAVSASSKAVAR